MNTHPLHRTELLLKSTYSFFVVTQINSENDIRIIFLFFYFNSKEILKFTKGKKIEEKIWELN